MDRFVNDKDYELINKDRCSFYVLNKILHGECDLILSDHKDIIFCHSTSPYPLWIWTPDNASIDVYEKVWNLIQEYKPFLSSYRYNIKYGLADYLIKKGKENNINIEMFEELCAYECDNPIKPNFVEDGYLYKCTSDDFDEALKMFIDFNYSIDRKEISIELTKESVRSKIDNETLFFYKNQNDDVVACCSYNIADKTLGSIGPVYTKPEYRRRHYAQFMVYHITTMIKEKGFTPMLYTNANYVASNECYKKIGYKLKGRLCTIYSK